MKERYLATVEAWEKAIEYHSSFVPQITHDGILDLLENHVHKVVVDGVTYMQADYACDDKELKRLCEHKYNFY